MSEEFENVLPLRFRIIDTCCNSIHTVTDSEFLELTEDEVDYVNDKINTLTEQVRQLREALEFVIENSEPHGLVDFHEARHLLEKTK